MFMRFRFMWLLPEKIQIQWIFSSVNWINGALFRKDPFLNQVIRIGITDKNFLGTAMSLKMLLQEINATGINSFITNYSIPNYPEHLHQCKFAL